MTYESPSHIAPGPGHLGVHSPVGPATDRDSAALLCLDRIAVALERIRDDIGDIRTHIAPSKGDVVGTPYLAQQLGCSVVWAAEMARKEQIPRSCIVSGTGNGKPWKFYRQQILEWLNKR